MPVLLRRLPLIAVVLAVVGTGFLRQTVQRVVAVVGAGGGLVTVDEVAVGVVVAGLLQAVAEGHGVELVVGAIADPVDQDERPMVVAGGNLADPADSIALVADVASIGVADADQAVAIIVAVAGDVGLAQFGFALLDEVAVAVVAVSGHAAFVFDAAQPADTVVTLVVRVGNVVGFARIVDAQQTILRVMAVAGGDAAGINTAQRVTGWVMGVVQTAAIRAVFVEQIVEAVALVVGLAVFWIGDAEQVVGAVVVVVLRLRLLVDCQGKSTLQLTSKTVFTIHP